MAITFDQSQSRFISFTSGNKTFSATNAGTDRCILVETAIYGAVVSLASYNAHSMTLIDTAPTDGGGGQLRLWGYIAPDSGTHDVDLVIVGGTTVVIARAFSFNGVLQTEDFSNKTNGRTSSGTSLDLSVTTVAADSALAIGGSSPSVDVQAGTNCTRASGSDSDNPFPGYYLISGAAGSYTIGISYGSATDLTGIAVELRASGGGGGGGKPWTYYAQQWNQSQLG